MAFGSEASWVRIALKLCSASVARQQGTSEGGTDGAIGASLRSEVPHDELDTVTMTVLVHTHTHRALSLAHTRTQKNTRARLAPIPGGPPEEW